MTSSTRNSSDREHLKWLHQELDRKGMTLMLLWQEYVAAHPEGRTWRYTQFCAHYK